MKEFNINNRVRVQMTERGQAMYREHWRGYNIDPPELKTDADGWTEFQAWELFQYFGPAVRMGADLPFMTTIQLGEE